LVESGAEGVFHLSNEGRVTWRDFAVEVLEQAGLRARIEPLESLGGSVRRPLYSAFSLAKARGAGVMMPEWREGVRAYVKSRGLGMNGSAP
jgi:dTDP-4-dehydrorhamnose reductase